MDVVIRELSSQRWPEAGAKAGRAFWTEEYMRILADDPIALYTTVQDIYLGMDISSPSMTALGAFAGEHIVGVACVDGPEECFFCSMDPEAPGPEDEAHRVLHGVNLAIRELHDGLPPHAYIGPIAVEPTLQGRGIGRRLLDAAWRTAVGMHPATVALDCDPRLLSYYQGFGFREVARGHDPWDFEIVGLRRDPVDG
jgi:ribosomal protein S18 acetylase RimI-like enzyme